MTKKIKYIFKNGSVITCSKKVKSKDRLIACTNYLLYSGLERGIDDECETKEQNIKTAT